MATDYSQALICRRDMPQIDASDLSALVVWLTWKGISVTDALLAPDKLQLRQRVAYDPSRMTAEELERPTLVSCDWYVLDGNHRTYGHKLNHSPERCLIVGLPFAKAIQALFTFAGTYRKEGTNGE